MEECIFCKIVRGEIKPEKIYEDKDTLAFLDINPINEGHTLVMPKEHYENLFDVPNDVLGKVMITAKKIATALDKMSDGVNIGQNNRRAAGQLVNHIHFHVIPRKSGDGLKHWSGKKYEDNKMKQTAEKIKNLL